MPDSRVTSVAQSDFTQTFPSTPDSVSSPRGSTEQLTAHRTQSTELPERVTPVSDTNNCSRTAAANYVRNFNSCLGKQLQV
jgi:hypothetical protein